MAGPLTCVIMKRNCTILRHPAINGRTDCEVYGQKIPKKRQNGQQRCRLLLDRETDQVSSVRNHGKKNVINNVMSYNELRDWL